MKIVDIAICVNNRDPEGLGRIRCIRYSDYTGQVERAFEYNDWDDKDLFTAIPFLPTNINFIPEVGQTVKLINYDTDKDTVNTEYIAGPFTTRHDYNSQAHSMQIERTSYGVMDKHSPTIMNDDGSYTYPTSEGAFALNTDYGVYGKYGSDVLFTNDGLVLRGGKLLSKELATKKQSEKMMTIPTISTNMSSLYLKKFPKSMEYVEQKTYEYHRPTGHLNYIIEYSVDNFTNTGTTVIDFFIYDTKKGGTKFRIENDKLEDIELNTLCTLIDSNGLTGTTGTPSFSITGVTATTEAISSEIRVVLSTLHHRGTRDYINTNIYNLHPFFFRPTKECSSRSLNTFYTLNRLSIFKNVSLYNSGPISGLVYSYTQPIPRLIRVSKKKKILKDKSNQKEQTFAAVKSDHIYLLSTDTNQLEPKVNFDTLDKYELTQKNYLQDIEPGTYALVRGEKLVDYLNTITDLLFSHIHNIGTPPIPSDPNYEKLFFAQVSFENEILNNSIRIN